MQWPITEEGNSSDHARTACLISILSTQSGVINERLGYIVQEALVCSVAGAAQVSPVISERHDLH